MTIQSILDAEAQVTDRVTIYYEGMFWKAYERSAYIICSQLRSFKPTKKVIKKMGGQEVISIGFPDTCLDALMQKHQKVSETHISRTYSGFRPLNEQEFLLWKNKSGSLPCPLPKEEAEVEPEPEQPHNPIPEVVQQLKDFDLLNHTPYDCLILVKELKKMLS